MTTLLTSISLALLPVAYWAGKRSVRKRNAKLDADERRACYQAGRWTSDYIAKLKAAYDRIEDEDCDRLASMAEAQGRRVG